MRCKAYDMLSPLILAGIILFLVSSTSATLLFRDVHAARLRERVNGIRSHFEEQSPSTPARTVAIRLTGQRSEHAARLMQLLRFNPDIQWQNVIPWQLVIAIACAVAVVGFFYGRAFLGWPFALLVMPIEGLFVARFIFGWERLRFQKAQLEQIPEVMALICRAVAAGIPLSEALRSVANDASSPVREEFVRVVNEVGIGQPLEGALWKLYTRVGLPEYAFFAVTIGLQAQTGGSLVETLQNLQDLVRKRVALSKRGKALAAEARMSAIILGALPFVMFGILTFTMDGFLDFFLDSPTGNHLLLVAAGLMSTGIFVMRQLIRRSLAP
jgi:tight adherence protein B